MLGITSLGAGMGSNRDKMETQNMRSCSKMSTVWSVILKSLVCHLQPSHLHTLNTRPCRHLLAILKNCNCSTMHFSPPLWKWITDCRYFFTYTFFCIQNLPLALSNIFHGIKIGVRVLLGPENFSTNSSIPLHWIVYNYPAGLKTFP